MKGKRLEGERVRGREGEREKEWVLGIWVFGEWMETSGLGSQKPTIVAFVRAERDGIDRRMIEDEKTRRRGEEGEEEEEKCIY